MISQDWKFYVNIVFKVFFVVHEHSVPANSLSKDLIGDIISLQVIRLMYSGFPLLAFTVPLHELRKLTFSEWKPGFMGWETEQRLNFSTFLTPGTFVLVTTSSTVHGNFWISCESQYL